MKVQCIKLDRDVRCEDEVYVLNFLVQETLDKWKGQRQLWKAKGRFLGKAHGQLWKQKANLEKKRLPAMQIVVERLETEAADNREAATKEAEKRETALKGRYQAALQAAQDSEHKHAERSVPCQPVLSCHLHANTFHAV